MRPGTGNLSLVDFLVGKFAFYVESEGVSALADFAVLARDYLVEHPVIEVTMEDGFVMLSLRGVVGKVSIPFEKGQRRA